MTKNTKIDNRLFSIVGLLLSVIIFIIDLQTPLGVADGICYVAVILLSILINNNRVTVAYAILCIILIILGYFFSPLGENERIALINRILSIITIFVCSVVIIKYKKSAYIVKKQQIELEQLTIDLKAMNVELEERIKNRTMILEEALKRVENSEEELKKMLEHEKELNELKSRFVSMASHEFRTPLATILSSLSLVSKYGDQNEKEKQNKHINRIKLSVTHLTDILNDVLSLSKLEEGRVLVTYDNFLVDELVADVIREMKLIAKDNQKIIYNHYGQKMILFDRKMLKHILINLISNAIKFSNEDGFIDISTELKDYTFTVIIRDNGIGISEEDKNHLFERFFRGNNVSAIQGTGLGLNIVAKHVELLKGKIDVISKLDEGTMFTITFSLT